MVGNCKQDIVIKNNNQFPEKYQNMITPEDVTFLLPTAIKKFKEFQVNYYKTLPVFFPLKFLS